MSAAVTVRPWVAHERLDLESAVEHGPLNGGDRMPCPGVLELDESNEGSAFVLAVCDRCPFEVAVRRSTVDLLELDLGENEEREEPWWQR